MRVVYAKHYGFCEGVMRAVGIAEKMPQGSYTLGPIVHNKTVVERLAERGVRVASPDDLAKKRLVPGAAIHVVIRAHGVPAEQAYRLKSMGYRVIDATCSNIIRQYHEADRLEDNGYEMWMAAERQPEGKAHPEITAKVSRLSRPAKIIACAEDIPSGRRYGKIALVPQTTFDLHEYGRILEKLRGMAEDVKEAGSICPATHQRQEAAMDLASRVDAMVIVGGGLDGQPSNNTMELHKASMGKNPRSYMIADASGIKNLDLRGVRTVGLTAGASTPDEIIEEVADVLRGM